MSRIRTVNAFTADDAGGNPAGVVLEADELSAADMQAIARRAGFAETAFVLSSKVASRRVRFFTPTEEVDLCGHATIATWSLLHQNGLPAGKYTQETLAGTLAVEIRDNGPVFMQQKPAIFYEEVMAHELASALGIHQDDMHASLAAQVVSTGLRDIMVPVREPAMLAKLQPDFAAISQISKEHDATGFHVFALCDEGESLTAARNFAPLVGIPEEAATGTSTGAMFCYLKKNKFLPKRSPLMSSPEVLATTQTYRAEQGRALGELSYIYATFVGGIVWIGGSARLMAAHP